MRDALSSAFGFILSDRPKKRSWRGANDDGLLRSCVAQNIYSASNQRFSNPWIPPCDVLSPVNTNQQTLSVLLRSLTYVSIYIF